MPRIRAREWDGTTWDDPSAERLYDLIADMSLTFRFLVVERLDSPDSAQHYIQVHLNDDLSHTVEYREGGPDSHYTAHVPRRPEPWGVEPLVEVVVSWASGDGAWRDALSWRKWQGEEPGTATG
jgi:hypothetical protein